MVEFFTTAPPCLVAMAACSGAHHLGRFIAGARPEGAVDPAAICQILRQDQETLQVATEPQSIKRGKIGVGWYEYPSDDCSRRPKISGKPGRKEPPQLNETHPPNRRRPAPPRPAAPYPGCPCRHPRQKGRKDLRDFGERPARRSTSRSAQTGRAFAAGAASAIAQTDFDLKWGRDYRRDGTDCVLAAARPFLTITYTFPKPAENLAPHVAARWRTFIAGIRAHEAVHGEYITAMAQDIFDTTVGFRQPNDPNCKKIRNGIQAPLKAAFGPLQGPHSRLRRGGDGRRGPCPAADPRPGQRAVAKAPLSAKAVRLRLRCGGLTRQMREYGPDQWPAPWARHQRAMGPRRQCALPACRLRQ